MNNKDYRISNNSEKIEKLANIVNDLKEIIESNKSQYTDRMHMIEEDVDNLRKQVQCSHQNGTFRIGIFEIPMFVCNDCGYTYKYHDDKEYLAAQRTYYKQKLKKVESDMDKEE
jgi:transposase-like protein